MSKKLRDLKWESVALEGFPANFSEKLHGFVGLEECTEYGLDADNKRSKKKKQPKKRRQPTETSEKVIPNKKIRLSNGFTVENCDSITPSLTNEESIKKKTKIRKNDKKNNKENKTIDAKAKADVIEHSAKAENLKNGNNKKTKVKIGEDISQTVCTTLTPEDMLTWAEFKLPEPILKALAELGYSKPTKIQQLSLPAAIHGRRDILGAAETGSGKTLAFGLPILTGILKLKEKADMGLDVYDIPFRKSSQKKKGISGTPIKHKGVKRQEKNENQENNAKESSEDGYSSGGESGSDESGHEESDHDESDCEDSDTESNKKLKPKGKVDDDFIEEYDVPVRKTDASIDEGNNSDDSDNYIHLSELVDLNDSSDDAKGDEKSGEGSDVVEESGVDEEIGVEEKESDDTEDEESNGEEEVNENQQGIGCVKVIDNIEMPGHVMVKTGKPLYALILTPTRELAIQVSSHLRAVAKYTGIRIATIVGGMAAVKQERILKTGPEVVVATPGRLWELISQGQPHLQQVDCIKFLAIDETDRMVEHNHFAELWPLLERLSADAARAAARQTFVFSATLTLVHDLPQHLQGKKVTKRGKILNRKVTKLTSQQKVNKLIQMFGMTDPKVVDITQENLGTAETLTESRITCSSDQKDVYLYYILKRHPGRTIVFCNAITTVRRLAQLLSILKCKPLPIHANMQQRQRLKNLEKFRDDPHGVLVATDVAARGLDIPDVEHVIHYHVPKTAENYVHRSGRTARASKEGLTILMMEPAEAYHYAKLCNTLNKTSEVPLFPIETAQLSPFKSIVSLAREVDALELKKRRTAQARGWREKAARELDIIIDDDDVPEVKTDMSLNKALKGARRQLDVMMSRPLFPRGFSFKYPTLNQTVSSEGTALQVMKKAIESGELKKEKRKGKNAPLFKLEKSLKKRV